MCPNALRSRIFWVVGQRHCAHLSFTDDEEGVSSGPLSDDVLSIFIMCLSEEKQRGKKTGDVLFWDI